MCGHARRSPLDIRLGRAFGRPREPTARFGPCRSLEIGPNDRRLLRVRRALLPPPTDDLELADAIDLPTEPYPDQDGAVRKAHESPGAGLDPVASGVSVSGAGSWAPMSNRNGGYLSVISAAYAPTRNTQRFMPITKSKMALG